MAPTRVSAQRQKLWLLLLIPMLTLACRVGTTPLANVADPTAQPTAAIVPVSDPLVPPAVVADEQSLLVNLFARVDPAVVSITIYTTQTDGQTGTNYMVATSQGSGFVYDHDRHIVTNAHVVSGAEEIDVTYEDGTISPATLIGADLNSDLAVIQAEKVPDGVQPIPLGDMSELAVGQTVVAIGNPFGLENTLTKGVISALRRTIPALTVFSIPDSIQTDAAINPGNSGGPLLNLQGELIGVNAQIETGSTSRSNSGVGFAIPASVVRRVVPDLIASGKTEWAWIGVRGGDLTPTLAAAMDLPVEQGAYLADITSGGPAAMAGLRGASEDTTYEGRPVSVGGDVITAIDGQPVRSFDDLLVYVALQTRPGQDVTLTIVRDGQTQEITLTLGTRPSE